MTMLKTRTKCRDQSRMQKNRPPTTLPLAGGKAGGRHMPSRDGGLAASVLTLRAEEPRTRIADYVTPLIVQRTARPIATRTSHRIGRRVPGIDDVAGLYRIGRICRVR